MVGILNIIAVAVYAAMLYAWWRTKKHWLLFAMIGLAVVYGQFQPSYLPKGEVYRTAPPQFSAPTGEIKDENRKPVTSEERNALQEQSYKDGLPWNNN